MSDEPIQEKAAVRLDASTRLAYERTYLAQERTQMAWVRTALAFISFGFTIAKFFESTKASVMHPRTVGLLLIGIGLVSLAVADMQHRRALKVLREQCPGLPVSLAGVTAGLLALLGILAMIGAILR